MLDINIYNIFIINYDVVIITEENYDALYAKAKGIIGDTEVDFYIEKEACNDNNLKCPVQQGLAQVYRAEVFVKEASLVS